MEKFFIPSLASRQFSSPSIFTDKPFCHRKHCNLFRAKHGPQDFFLPKHLPQEISGPKISRRKFFLAKHLPQQVLLFFVCAMVWNISLVFIDLFFFKIYFFLKKNSASISSFVIEMQCCMNASWVATLWQKKASRGIARVWQRTWMLAVQPFHCSSHCSSITFCILSPFSSQ